MAGDTPGPELTLTDDLLAEIKNAVFAGGTLKEIANRCGVKESTFYHWHSDNTANLRDKIEGWRRDAKLEKADKNIEKILDLGVEDKDTLKVVADMSKFVAETLGKDQGYSKRSELTGKDGKDLELKPILVKFMDCDDGAKNN